MAVCLPDIWEYMLGNMDKCIDVRGQEYLLDIFNKIAQAMGGKTPIEAIALFRKMMFDMELMNPMAGNKKDELHTLSTSVNPIRLKNNPVLLDECTIISLYSRIVM